MSGTPNALAADLDELARRTWQRVRWGPEWNMTLREDGITDENLFQLHLKHPYLNVKKFRSAEESANGADWEWWIGSDAEGWVGLRIQAKKMFRMRYDELRYQSASQTRIQCQVLVEEVANDAAGRSLYPFYCFYNGWDESTGWPDGVDWTVGCSKPANCGVVPDVSIFGCAVAPADQVLDVILHSKDPLKGASILPLQRPWSWLFGGGPQRVKTLSAATVQRQIAMVMQMGPEEAQAPRYAELPDYAMATREAWHDSDLREVAQFAPTSYVVTVDLGDQRFQA